MIPIVNYRREKKLSITFFTANAHLLWKNCLRTVETRSVKQKVMTSLKNGMYEERGLQKNWK